MKVIILILLLLFNSVVWSDWPSGLSFIGWNGQAWNIYLEKDNQTIEVKTELEPKSHAWDKNLEKLVYIAADESIRIKHINNPVEIILLSDITQVYTQPVFSPDGTKVYLVHLEEKMSKSTQIISLDIHTSEMETLVNQASGQFHPFIKSNNLYYAKVHCVVGCGHIIQEIWQKNIISGYAQQITLQNAISDYPFVTQKALYFSSNKHQYYHIWRYDFTNKTYQNLTSGYVNDINPVVYQDQLYFIRQTPTQTALMVKNLQNLQEKTLFIQNIRDLRLAQ